MQIYVDGRVCRYLQYSGIAIAVAHEITHGFDDEGYSCMIINQVYMSAAAADDDVKWNSFVEIYAQL